MGKGRSANLRGSFRENLKGYQFDRVIMPPKAGSGGEGITVIFRDRASGSEKPLPYAAVTDMLSHVRNSLIASNRLTRRDRALENCTDPVLGVLIAAKSAADRARHNVRTRNFA